MVCDKQSVDANGDTVVLLPLLLSLLGMLIGPPTAAAPNASFKGLAPACD